MWPSVPNSPITNSWLAQAHYVMLNESKYILPFPCFYVEYLLDVLLYQFEW